MTKVLEDLAIYDTVLPDRTLGSLDFCTIEESEDSFLEDFFVVLIRKDISEDQMVPTVCHELEHYDVAQALLNLELFTKYDLLVWKEETVDAKGVHVLTRPFREWLHSNPSYLP